MKSAFQYLRGDRVIWLVVILLSLFSVLAVYSSTGTLAYKQQSGDTTYYLFKHAFLLIFGFLLMYVAHTIKYTVYSRLSVLMLWMAVPMLLLTLLMGISLNEASRWITLPIINVTFQTSDFAKLALITYVARFLAKKQDEIKDFRTAFVPVMVPILLVCGLILPANFSTAAMLFTTCIFLLFLGRINFKYIMLLFLAGAICFSLFILVAKAFHYEGRIGTWQKRIESFVGGKPDDSYQAVQAKIAIAAGGVMGKGPGNSTQRNFLPHPYSDMIFPIICEEYGLLGALIVVFLYLTLLYRGVRIVKKSPRAFASLLAIGCTFSLVFQAVINMAVAVNIFPVTGQPLPLLSMGGTSIWFTSISIGIILSVSRDIEAEEPAITEGGKLATA